MKITDPKTKLFIEFFSKEMGVKFIDADTGERITVKDNEVVRIKDEEERAD